MIAKVETKKIKDSIPVTCNSEILQKIVDIMTYSYKNKKANLSQNLLAELQGCFGLPNKKMRLENLTSIWVLGFGDLVFNVFTAKGKGTSIEICNYDYVDMHTNDNLKNKIIKFLEQLHNTINT